MHAIGENIWIVDGEAVPFFTLPYTTRMTVIRQANYKLWIHSPIRLTPELQQEIDALGEVEYLIAPNHLHHLFVHDWQQAYPNARTYGTQQVIDKRPDLRFDGVLNAEFVSPWHEEIAYLLFTGSKVMQEAVFFHRASATLIVTDLIENFSPKAFGGWKMSLAKAAGVVAPHGKMPLDWRLSFTFHKREAKQHLDTILTWQPHQIVMAHGERITENGTAFLRRSFSWLQ
ncbi:DUF4336 domain-containing protein [Vibrio fluvialis]|uniref:DUF4336 domain-containing protein n=1 Tax=Vibrio fluvialis TaxID=676 RepID=UPI000648DB97|nr:DUF4336 domain-containing protein [Vibrio fluvialis]